MNSPYQPAYLPAEVLSVLGSLASEHYQLRWITNATAAEYVLPSDLLNDVEAVARWAAGANTVPGVLAIIHGFLADYYRCLETMPRHIDVQQEPAWQKLRRAAARTLTELGHAVPDALRQASASSRVARVADPPSPVASDRLPIGGSSNGSVGRYRRSGPGIALSSHRTAGFGRT